MHQGKSITTRLFKSICWVALALMLSATLSVGEADEPSPQSLPAGAREVEDGWFAPVRDVQRPSLPDPVARSFIIPIHGPITGTTYDVVQRKITRSRGGGAELIIFDMDTPGGSSKAMVDIVELILSELKDIYTVVYVNSEAISAGAIISLACNEIVLTPHATIGDAMPIMVGPGGQLAPMPEKERGKIESYMTTKSRVLAKRNGYNVAMCEAMITITMEIWLIKDVDTGQLQMVEAKEWRKKVTGGPGEAEGDNIQWHYVRTIVGPDKLVTMTADEAIEYGFARHIFADITELQQHYRTDPAPQMLADTWSERLVGFLTSPAVTGILLMAAIFLAYIEMNTPGFGIPGGIAVACFAILIGSRFLIGLANWWELALLGLGFALILIEVFVIPGFGITGIGGILCVIIALLAMILPNAPDKLPIPVTDLDWQLLSKGAFALAAGFLAALVAGFWASKYLRKIPFASKIVLAAAEAATEAPATETAPIQRIRVGDVGTVESICRPVGKVRFGEVFIDAISEGEMIDVGQQARVLRRDGNRLVVEKA